MSDRIALPAIQGVSEKQVKFAANKRLRVREELLETLEQKFALRHPKIRNMKDRIVEELNTNDSAEFWLDRVPTVGDPLSKLFSIAGYVDRMDRQSGKVEQVAPKACGPEDLGKALDDAMGVDMRPIPDLVLPIFYSRGR